MKSRDNFKQMIEHLRRVQNTSMIMTKSIDRSFSTIIKNAKFPEMTE